LPEISAAVCFGFALEAMLINCRANPLPPYLQPPGRGFAHNSFKKGHAMTLPVPTELPPMESRAVDSIPEGELWAYEPKWDGFRCIAFRDGDDILLQSKAGQPLARYFPELVEALRASKADKFVVDGEIVVPSSETTGGLSFDQLLQRVHPAESRIRRLAAETPAVYIIFDLLVDAAGKDLTKQPLEKRRAALEKFYAKHFAKIDSLKLSPLAESLATARKWFG
jgi:ATP-dependent DNA ligase